MCTADSAYRSLTMVPYVLAAWLPAWVLRWFRWHLANIVEPQQAGHGMQFHLADVWRWCTMLCILLAVMVGFRNELTGWDGLGNVILLYLGWMAAAPAGLVVSLLFWAILTEP